MRAIPLEHVETGRRHVIACIQQVVMFYATDEWDDWRPVQVRRRWRQ